MKAWHNRKSTKGEWRFPSAEIVGAKSASMNERQESTWIG
jgi:hypothetical protein